MDRSEMQAQLRKENLVLAAQTKKSVLSKFMYSEGFQSVPYYEYYRDIFPSGELAKWKENPKEHNETQWLYNGVLLMDTGKTKNITKQDCFGEDFQVKKKTKTRLMVFDDLYAIDVAVNKALKNGRQSLMSPISYCGRSRAIESERFLYAVIIEIDGLRTQKIEGKRDHEQIGMKTLLQQIKSNLYLSPSYIVCSGSGVHLVWLLNEPMPLCDFPTPKKFDFAAERKKRKSKDYFFRNRTNRGNNFTLCWDAFRLLFTGWVWNKEVSKECIQFEYHGQGFRTVGSIGKKGHLVEVFKICDKRYSMAELCTQPETLCTEDLTPFGVGTVVDFLANFTKAYYEKKGFLKKETHEGQAISKKMKEAKQKWPEWYERRIVRKEPVRQKGEWEVSKNVYNWYKNLIIKGAFVGCRYWRLYTLAQYARKCHVPYDELHADGVEIGESFKAIDNGESLNDYDIEKALSDGYSHTLAPKSAIDFINEKAQVNIQKNRRNGQKQVFHLEDMRQKKEDMKQNGQNFKNPEGRPPKIDIISEWRAINPDGRKIDCINETGLAKSTVYKWWDIA